MADVMEALGIISQAASNIHATDVAARMDTLRIEAEQTSRLKEVELQGTISEYYDLKQEREQVATTLRTEYPTDSHATQVHALCLLNRLPNHHLKFPIIVSSLEHNWFSQLE